MIDLLKADLYRLQRSGVFYIGLVLLTGADLFYEGLKGVIQKEQMPFLKMMISGGKQKILFAAVGMFLVFYVYQEKKSGFFRQTQPLYPKWQQMAERLLFGALVSFLAEIFFFIEHLGKVSYLQISGTAAEWIETEAFFVGSIFLCTVFAAAGLCLAEWLKYPWVSAALVILFVWGWPLHAVFEKMLEVSGGAEILYYGTFETFARFCREIREGTFLEMLLVSCIWTAGFGGFAFLGRLRR